MSLQMYVKQLPQRLNHGVKSVARAWLILIKAYHLNCMQAGLDSQSSKFP